MHTSKTHNLLPSGAGAICRVIRQGSVYLCGMCRSPYASFSHGMSCVQDCWEEVLRLDPVIARRQGRNAVLYRCRFCARDYPSRELASHCATDCRERFKIRFALEMEAWGQVEDLTSKPLGRRLPRRSLQLVPMPVTRKKPRKDGEAKNTREGDAAHEPETSHTKKEESPGETPSSPVPAADATPTAAAKPAVKEKRAPSEPFSRNGAQYVCNMCQKKYFTKDEVVTCFESHGTG